MWRPTMGLYCERYENSGKQEQHKRKKANGTVQQRPLWFHLRLNVV